MKNRTMSNHRHVLKERDYKSSGDDEKNRKKDKHSSSKPSSHSHKSRRSSSPHQSHHRKKSPLKSKIGYDNSDHHKSRKHKAAEINESYEELSRRKRKLESELRALDLEEAAEKEAENKRARKERSDVKRETRHKEYRSSSRSDNEVRERSDVKRETRHREYRSSSKSDNEVRERSDVKREARHREYRSSSRSDNEVRERSDVKREARHREYRSSSRSDNDDRKSSKNKAQDIVVKEEKDKGHSSKSSGDEKNWGRSGDNNKDSKTEKEKPNLAVSGKLAEETNTYNGIAIKYNEPAEARKPKRKWRLYPFKGDTDLPFIPIHRQSAYLFGRTRLIADIPIDHPSCSKQHAVLQYRLVPFKREDGTTGRRVRPYIIDLESSNGTFVNNQKVEPRCYVELIEKDVIKFGYSSREYVILHEESKNDDDDDVQLETNDLDPLP